MRYDKTRCWWIVFAMFACGYGGRRVVRRGVKRLVRRRFEAIGVRNLALGYSRVTAFCLQYYLRFERIVWEVLVARRAWRTISLAKVR